MDETHQTDDRLTQARGTVLWNLFFSGQMRDDFIGPEELEAIRTKPFREWPEALQEKMIPFGGEMIQ